ncbi:hypothetical protein SDC9_56742 [bioreactor metagenome]|uniref:Uncharacterized protein n=1 Tax=bioreactor metagenome TaxID=1076179 RepID=A0A644X2N3_9ZZZZ
MEVKDKAIENLKQVKKNNEEIFSKLNEIMKIINSNIAFDDNISREELSILHESMTMGIRFIDSYDYVRRANEYIDNSIRFIEKR